MKSKSKIQFIGGSFLNLLILSACAPGFKVIDPQKKQEFLNNNWIFNDATRVAAANLDSGSSGSGTSMAADNNSTTSNSGSSGTSQAATPGSGSGSNTGGGGSGSGSSTGGILGGGGSGSGGSTGGILGGGGSGSGGSTGGVTGGGGSGSGGSTGGVTGGGGSGSGGSTGGVTGGGSGSGSNTGGAGSGSSYEVPVTYFCGNRLSSDARVTLYANKGSYKLQILDSNASQVLCERSGDDLRDTLLNEKKLLLPTNCPDLKGKDVALRLWASGYGSGQEKKVGDAIVGNLLYQVVGKNKQEGPIYRVKYDDLFNQPQINYGLPSSRKKLTTTASQKVSRKKTNVAFNASTNKKGGKRGPSNSFVNTSFAAGFNNTYNNESNQGFTLYVLYDNKTGDEAKNCDYLDASPLFIDMGGRGMTELTKITEGVRFDILGVNAKPIAHTKKQISWFTDPNFMFLVKPNQRGEVLGIDEMFGDNTRSPAGEKSDNGFSALAKYDSDGNQLINDRDPVYNDLRMWSDINADGIAEPGELFYLDFLGIEVLDLSYDPDYYEVDKYGNKILFKSVVKMKDDSFRLMFDLWFRYL